jgi:hypothetical protein
MPAGRVREAVRAIATGTVHEEPWTHRVAILPTTRPGWWAVGLALANVVLVLSWTILPGGAALGFLAGLAGGVVALVAIVRHRDRALAGFLAIAPPVLVVLFVLAELLISHE